VLANHFLTPFLSCCPTSEYRCWHYRNTMHRQRIVKLDGGIYNWRGVHGFISGSCTSFLHSLLFYNTSLRLTLAPRQPLAPYSNMATAPRQSSCPPSSNPSHAVTQSPLHSLECLVVQYTPRNPLQDPSRKNKCCDPPDNPPHWALRPAASKSRRDIVCRRSWFVPMSLRGR
jgi:hypothetical protein